ncbi:DUF5686 and carboxypeptidase-like regulatory domain-containing protein [Polluticoccus soli]|uniref:DUF5686 and carboxypeptidase-like regulatory domain-containing protein n=1 Tax=Polluticoccus soli TaxID=3034150 RepID=UPI0023E18843|nr:DUF5686 and carboxypeptidase-like regulatory domain-containing protein [Flavipsychrobacter sp. JY13-12]
MKAYTRPAVLLVVSLILGGGWHSHAQTTDSLKQATDSAVAIAPSKAPQKGSFRVAGKVVDKQSGEPVPFATVFFPYSSVGTATEADGSFSIDFEEWPHDTLRVQLMGYMTQNKRISRQAQNDQLILSLERNSAILNEVVIKAGEDPALILLRKIVERKPQNDPEQANSYSCETYNKVEIDILRLSKEEFEKLPVPFIKNLSFIYNNLDTVSGKEPFLPFFLVETLSDYYTQKEPKKTREIIKANQIRGINNESITQYMGKMHLAINPYDNYVVFFDKQFVSPISGAGAVFYKYRILDTTEIEGHKVISVSFRPQRPGENCFTGIFKVVDSVYALQYIEAEVPATANINWIKNATFYKQYAPVADSAWFCVKENLTAEIVVSPDVIKLPGFIGRRTTMYRNVKLNDERVHEIVEKNKLDVIVSDTARGKSENFWSTARHEELSKNEQAIYGMFDTLESTPTYKRFKNLARFFVTGGVFVGPFEFGPYWNVYSKNVVEGSRLCFSMGTNKKFSKQVYLNGYLAYGTKDEKFKYNLSALWLPKRLPRTYLFASYTSDIDKTVNYYDDVSFDNIVSMAIRKKGIPYKFVFSRDARVEVFKSYQSGFSHKVTAKRKDYDPYDPLPSVTIFTDNLGQTKSTITNTEVDIALRYAYRERFLEGNYYRVSLGSKYPIVEAHYAKGLKDVLNGGYNYHKVSFTVSDDVRIAPFGALYFNVFGGKYFGTLPYLLLENHPGNENYYYNKYAFNMMNKYEFLSDQYIGANIEHSIGGGIFKYIPLIKKAHLRQFWTAKGVIGSLNNANSALNLNKGYAFKTLESAPYVEVGTGIENIFRLFRVDFVWRVLPEARPNEPKQKYFGIFGSMKIDF